MAISRANVTIASHMKMVADLHTRWRSFIANDPSLIITGGLSM